ncbi:unnamed protein product [Acanthoscelides obtectus]|uniref:Uncharacterized protein n=1 Tax=Acanthoscelides obtectus TaxID=200917 RepID=A0A9P0K1M2_ACAOB|nr:unnamed protein product [Acanthoscelides obtectus]CAK1660321.1 hypothetical protein AOBTE_LOCUS21989 [Acanthoscelides obtectus]
MQFGEAIIGYPLLNIVNTSLRTGKMPSLLKRSIIVPVLKAYNPNKPEDLRSINLMPVVEKVIEITVHEQLSEHLYELAETDAEDDDEDESSKT